MPNLKKHGQKIKQKPRPEELAYCSKLRQDLALVDEDIDTEKLFLLQKQQMFMNILHHFRWVIILK
jgi:hypothetical protein